MPSNAKALSKMRNAILDLMDLRDRATSTQAQKASIKAAIRAIEDEYLATIQIDANLDYAEITGKLTKATNHFNKIVAERKQLETALTSAAKILGSIGSILKLIL